ncbi:response regulator receiver protein [Methylopila sp. Yamaguchi]|nr:response regulator receiver protein [Methylopila sp. Yamaguchi]
MKLIIIKKSEDLAHRLSDAAEAEGYTFEFVSDAPKEGAPSVAGGRDVALIAAATADPAVADEVAVLRARHPKLYVIVAAATDDLEARLACYEAGADDCLAPPFAPREFAAKLAALRRRRAAGDPMPLLAGYVARLDVGALLLRADGRSRSVTKREADLLVLLARSAGASVAREDVLRKAWGAPARMTPNSVDVYVGYARRKLELLGADVTIETVRGVGFRLAPRAAQATGSVSRSDRSS